MTSSSWETPPRLWGRFCRCFRSRIPDGNTPTPVGKIPLRFSTLASSWKHPHACGEDPHLYRAENLGTETPPRLWGRYAEGLPSEAVEGNTPTPVGKIRRICVKREVSFETPPRLWGRCLSGGTRSPEIGNTPTPVGKIPVRAAATPPTRKHPHACGEDYGHRSSAGSPLGNTPTPVGKIATATRRSGRWRKHPHACGEDQMQA